MNKKAKIAVTGGTGFAGSHILRALVEQGYTNIYALRRSNSQMGLVSDIQDKIHWIEGDLLDIKSLEALITDADGVLHAAAKVSYHPRDRESVLKINVEGTANVVNVSLSRKVKKFIFLSSVAAIGRTKPGVVIDEDTQWSYSKKTSNYALSKHLAELEVWRGMHEGLKVGILNPSMILGPSYWGDSSTKLFTYVAKGQKFYPPGSNGFVDVRDVAILTVEYLKSKVENERIIAISEMASYQELLKLIADGMNKNPPSIKLSKWLASIYWRLTYFSKDPAVTKETVNVTTRDYIYDNQKSIELLDANYHTLASSVKDACAIFLKNKKENQDFGFFSKIYP